ncbi:sigma-70 family RNA polymerase sigma factor [Janthinobacterium agaricidamnosum]|uniref:RNA polymerase sigma factor, sigma-70 family protein n=1 Tax=Janthinobacterium agaricidamnosum NBRC 102515 = DSM 9628 TaxID=1349767 RepID=W0VF23_9BURK|nr:sigma-70 family RNA polymerase sigma factor [Janthinobacterium agaricidamnosum]CDG86063.1 RNA polymerase sigma factor, sigma-70 family protein [Janthinobacterium agaricidamnosum NBRC 102515 = DSM 9628]
MSTDANPLDPQQLRTWLLAAGKKDAAAFRRLYDTTSSKLFGFALRILHKQELAEEALQESFVAIWNNAATYQSHLAAPMTWMATIVRNKAFDMLRRSDDTVEIDAEQFDSEVMNALRDPQATPIEALQISGDAKALALCMSALEGLHRQVLALAYYHDMSHSEVAQQMTLPVGTVKTWIRRSLERLRTCLAKREQS